MCVGCLGGSFYLFLCDFFYVEDDVVVNVVIEENGFLRYNVYEVV